MQLPTSPSLSLYLMSTINWKMPVKRHNKTLQSLMTTNQLCVWRSLGGPTTVLMGAGVGVNRQTLPAFAWVLKVCWESSPPDQNVSKLEEAHLRAPLIRQRSIHQSLIFLLASAKLFYSISTILLQRKLSKQEFCRYYHGYHVMFLAFRWV